MSMNARNNINGNTPQDLNKMNENFMSLWKTLYGGIDFDNTNIRTQNKINTQWLTVQGEGNYDIGFPTYVRFFVPPDTKKVVSSNFNFLKERYRMDSGIAKGGGGVEDVDIAMSMGDANVGISSIGGGSSSQSSTSPVKTWYWFDPDGNKKYEKAPSKVMGNYLWNYFIDGFYHYVRSPIDTLGVLINNKTVDKYDSDRPVTRIDVNYLDLALLNHEHEVDTSIPNHHHDIVLKPHTHTAKGKITLDPHIHELNEGIKVSSKDAGATSIVVNGQTVGSMETGINSISNLDISEFIKIGEWNIIKISTNTLARMTVYGTVELIKN